MRSTHCILAALAVAAVTVATSMASNPARAQQPAPPAGPLDAATSTLTVFLRAMPIGSEQSSVVRNSDGWTITSSGRLNVPYDVVTRRFQARYDGNWKPLELTSDSTVHGQPYMLRAVVEGRSIKMEVTDGTQPTATTTATTDAELLIPNLFFASFEALAAKLRTAAPGATISAFIVPQAPVSIRVGESTDEQIQTAKRLIRARHTRFAIGPAGLAPAEADLWADETGRLLRLSIPAEGLDVVRDDVASVAARQVPVSRPNDEAVRIPANGFSLAGTLSKPAAAGTAPLPAIVLLGGPGPADRDEMAFGVPVMGQLANALADAGFLTLRYDKRGVGQSGGRSESAALADYAEDLRAAVKMLADRKDVDGKRIAVVGHGAGGAIALMAAAKDKRVAALGLLAVQGVTGATLILEQQQHVLGRSKFTDAEKQQKVETQKQINEAVTTGKGWEKLSADIRRQVDTPEFQSILTTDPAKIMPEVRQPILILQGELDTEVAPVNADRLAELARKRKNAPPVQVARLPGLNHLLVPAATGEAEEYATLKDRNVSPAVAGAIAGWLKTALAAR